MRKTRKIITMIVFVATTCGIVRASSPGTHMYIGSQTFEIWQTFDSDFTDCLNGIGCTDQYSMLVRKYYYLGLTLPDMFNFQEEIRQLINTLYDKRDNMQDG